MADQVRLGAATMTDEDMEARSKAIKEAQALAKIEAEAAARLAAEQASAVLGPEVPEGKVRVSVTTQRAHYRAGRYWPAATVEVRNTVADVSPEQLAILEGDHELVVSMVGAPAKKSSKPKE